MYFKDKIIWITGASSGAGEALTYAFEKEGATLIISARRELELERVKLNCENQDKIFVLPIDLEKHEELTDKAKIVLQKYGKVDILFNNGGLTQRSIAVETDFSVDKKLIDINYLGTVALTKAVLPSMIENKSGHIVVMSSLTGKFGTRMRSSYSASKHALHGFFDSLRAEVYNDNINISIISAGFIRTNIARNALTKNGELQKHSDPKTDNGMLPEVFAKKALKAIKKQKEEIVIGGNEIIGIYLKRFFPLLFSKIIRKANVK